jgi:hypothetical protein
VDELPADAEVALRLFVVVDRFGAEAFDPFGDGLWRDVEVARGGGLRQPAIDNRANHHFSTFRRQRRILMGVRSVLCESLTFGDSSVHGPNRMDNFLKAHFR